MRIEGYFRGIKGAREAVQKLKTQGFNNSVVDINDHYTANDRDEPKRPGTRNAPTESGLIFDSGQLVTRDRNSPMLAASPMASGMGNFREVTNTNYKVKVETDDNNAEKVKQLLQQYGGKLEDPNLNLPKHITEKTHIDDFKVSDLL
ncbi:MAG: hypothetical protein Q8936_11950 [Bacillota bacterium]|nr:hypothetical protein [Bacillota bacterium]